MRIVVDCKKDANANVILNKLFKMTALQSSFSVNNIALVKGRPRLLTLKDCVKYFVEHRHDVTIRRTKFELKKAKERAHLLEALIIACDNIDEVVKLIRSSKTPGEAVQKLMAAFNFDEVQAKYVVDMRLSQLTGLRMEQLHAEFDEIMKTIEYLQSILDDPMLCRKVMKDELQEVKEKYGDERRTRILPYSGEMNVEDLIAEENVVVTVTHSGFIKRTKADEYRAQHRGERGGFLDAPLFGDHQQHAQGQAQQIGEQGGGKRHVQRVVHALKQQRPQLVSAHQECTSSAVRPISRRP